MRHYTTSGVCFVKKKAESDLFAAEDDKSFIACGDEGIAIAFGKHGFIMTIDELRELQSVLADAEDLWNSFIQFRR